MKQSGLTTFRRAYSLVQAQAKTLGVETVSLGSASGRVAAKNIYAPYDNPPFNRSRRDGYACRLRDTIRPLKNIGMLVAGSPESFRVKKGECVRIMTGAPIPQGADCVVEIERTVVDSGGMVIVKSHTSEKFINYKGEELKRGKVLIKAGTVLNTACVAILAANGIKETVVYKTPRVAIIATGDELLEPGKAKKNPAQMFNASAWALLSALVEENISAKYYGIIPDDKAKLTRVIAQAADENDIVLTLGGVSMGDYDFVPAAAKSAGFKTIFHKVNIRPGKPLFFARGKSSLFFGLPGNTVSTLVTFELFVKDLLQAMQKKDISRNIKRVVLEKDRVRPALDVYSLLDLKELTIFPADRAKLLKGESADVRLMQP